MFRSIEEDLATRPRTFRAAPPSPSRASVEETIEALQSAVRPVIVLGAGAVRSAGARPALEAFLARTSIPVVETSAGMGVLPRSAATYLGGLAELAALQHGGQAPDLLLLLGTRRGISLGGRGTALLPAIGRVVHVDVDPAELGRIGNPDIPVIADVTEFVLRLTDTLDGERVDFTKWNEAAHAATGPADAAWQGIEPVTASGRIHPYAACSAIWDALAPDDVVVTDGGEASGWAIEKGRAQNPGDYQGIGMLGGLGIGTGFSIGLSCARPGQRVVAITGDGAIGFHLQEWDTMVRHSLPVTTVVLNNLGWGMSFHGQDIVFGEGHRVVSDLPDIRYDRIAEGFGLHAERVERVEDIGPALNRARESGRPSCIDITTAPDAVHPMMQALSQELPEGATRIPYYEPIPAGEL